MEKGREKKKIEKRKERMIERDKREIDLEGRSSRFGACAGSLGARTLAYDSAGNLSNFHIANV